MTDPQRTEADAVAARRTAASSVWLVARRELVTRTRSKAFLVSTALLVAALVALSLVMKAVNTGDDAKNIALTSGTSALSTPVATAAKSAGTDVDTRTVSSRSAAEQQVKDEDVDAALVGDAKHFTVVVKEDLDDDLTGAVNLLARQQALNQQITKLGGDPAHVNQAVASSKAHVVPLTHPKDFDGSRITLGMLSGILIFMSLQGFGQMVAQGVVEEKTSRVVELLLATIRPWQLMAGKVLGIGLVGLAQLVVVGGIGMTFALGSGVLDLGLSSAVGVVAWLVVWYLIGFFMYSLVLAAAGALVSRQEDIGGVLMPVLAGVFIPYIVGVTVLPGDPGSGLVEVLSLVPLFSPVLMPMRLALGGVPVWEILEAVLLSLALIPGLVWLSGRIYRNAVLRTGARVNLRESLRAN